MSEPSIRPGYRIDRVYIAQQQYELVDQLDGLPDEGERSVSFGWDWKPIRARTFEVVVHISVDPNKAAPERVAVRVVGVFSAAEGPLSIPFAKFVKMNAVAILYPFAREAISSLTGRGPFGAFHLEPINVVVLLGAFDISKSGGAVFLDQHPELAATFDLDYRANVGGADQQLLPGQQQD